ncbi:hypothetical protein ABT187_38880 [Streptomyces sp. NPDC001817]|uniref:hypothetical protein n=1 Tax=Streptomyces sp. NPDC001817 TaxID=3154398 RepID=UPI003326ED70
MQTRLAAEGPPTAPDRFVADPFLRTLLLLRLYQYEGDDRRWRVAHETLIGWCRYGDGGAPRHHGHRLHRELALGDDESALGHLSDAGAATEPVPFAALTADRLAEALDRVVRQQSYSRRSAVAAAHMAQEGGAGRVVKAVEAFALR